MKIVVTGIAGKIGGIVARELRRDHEVVGLDLRAPDGLPAHLVDLCEREALPGLFRGADAVIHLAAEPRHGPEVGWDLLMPRNVVPTANVFQAAHDCGVRRVVFASSMHVMGLYELDEPYRSIADGRYEGIEPGSVPLVTAEMPPRPDGRYAVTKLFGESLGRYYAEAEGMEVVSVRIGTVGRDDRPGGEPRSYVSWLSHRDAAGFFRACVERPGLRHEVLYAASANRWRIYDTPRAWRVLGFAPVDSAEAFRPS
ncbi:MAG: NAD(P)-dependent oxidoreductase [Gemmatimonadetes bacterium]|nr:NAD(P)-dependent oxidoreductase [Gemmatimonadota bacterium]